VKLAIVHAKLADEFKRGMRDLTREELESALSRNHFPREVIRAVCRGKPAKAATLYLVHETGASERTVAGALVEGRRQLKATKNLGDRRGVELLIPEGETLLDLAKRFIPEFLPGSS
jgi:hypothetical protein